MSSTGIVKKNIKTQLITQSFVLRDSDEKDRTYIVRIDLLNPSQSGCSCQSGQSERAICDHIHFIRNIVLAKPVCLFGWDCPWDNSEHRRDFSHPMQ